MELNGSAFKLQWLELTLCALVICMCLIAAFVHGHQVSKRTAPEDAKQSGSQTASTADQQKMMPADRVLTQKIRKAIHHDKSLSWNGRNIRIFAQDGKVMLRGSVRSEEEKNNLESKAMAASGDENVTNQLEVTAGR
jgi:hyperosmotically inducible periplasmic protein